MKRHLIAAIAASSFISSCSKPNPDLKKETPITPKIANRMSTSTTLGAPIAEAKIYKLLPGYNSSDVFEASGVYSLNGYFYVACDNTQKIAKIKNTLPINSSNNTLNGTGSPGSGTSNFEAISYDSHGTVNFFTVEESA